MRLRFVLNGRKQEEDISSTVLLVDLIRGTCGLTGTKVGCGTGDCGACSVLLNGSPVCSCLIYAAEVEGCSIDTVEGLSKSPIGRVLVDEMIRADASQCGFCTPGIVVSACALLGTTPPIDVGRSLVVGALAGNLCRCTGYLAIIDAVCKAAAKLASGQQA